MLVLFHFRVLSVRALPLITRHFALAERAGLATFALLPLSTPSYLASPFALFSVAALPLIFLHEDLPELRLPLCAFRSDSCLELGGN